MTIIMEAGNEEMKAYVVALYERSIKPGLFGALRDYDVTSYIFKPSIPGGLYHREDYLAYVLSSVKSKLPPAYIVTLDTVCSWHNYDSCDCSLNSIRISW